MNPSPTNSVTHSQSAAHAAPACRRVGCGAGDLDRPFRGVRVRRAARTPRRMLRDGVSATHALRDRALVFALAMPANQFFTHVTAAVLWGLPLPLSVLRDSFCRLRSLDVGVFRPLRHPRHAGVIGHQVKPRLAESSYTSSTAFASRHRPALGRCSVRSSVMNTTSSPSLTPQCARIAVPARPDPIATIGRAESRSEGRPPLGAPAIRLALDRMRTRSASSMETRCRFDPHRRRDARARAQLHDPRSRCKCWSRASTWRTPSTGSPSNTRVSSTCSTPIYRSTSPRLRNPGRDGSFVIRVTKAPGFRRAVHAAFPASAAPFERPRGRLSPPCSAVRLVRSPRRFRSHFVARRGSGEPRK